MLPSVPYVLHRSSARLNEFSPSLEEELKANAMAATGDRHYASFSQLSCGPAGDGAAGFWFARPP